MSKLVIENTLEFVSGKTTFNLIWIQLTKEYL